MGDFLEAAYKILKAERRPLTAREITDLAKQGEILETRGKTPWQTMKSKLSTDILANKDKSVFMRSGKGRFALRVWKKDLPEHIADRFQKALFDEEIVVIPAGALKRYLPGPGLFRGSLDTAALRRECTSMRRRIAEENPDVIQLVSVFILRYKDSYLTYKRTRRLPEKRLHGYYSIAFGGHLNPDDMPGLFDIFVPEQGRIFLMRELSEEVKFAKEDIRDIRYRGLLYDDSRPVSSQHLGIVYEVGLGSDEYEIGERGFLMDSRFETLGQIQRRLHEFENWSITLVTEEIRRCHPDFQVV